MTDFLHDKFITWQTYGMTDLWHGITTVYCHVLSVSKETIFIFTSRSYLIFRMGLKTFLTQQNHHDCSITFNKRLEFPSCIWSHVCQNKRDVMCPNRRKVIWSNTRGVMCPNRLGVRCPNRRKAIYPNTRRVMCSKSRGSMCLKPMWSHEL